MAIPPAAISGSVGPGADQAEQGEEPVVLVMVGVGEGTAVPARLDPLHDESVRSCRSRLHSLLRIGDGHPHRRPDLLQPLHHRGVGAAEGERHHRDPLLHQQVHLLLVVVIVEPVVAQHHPESRRLVT